MLTASVKQTMENQLKLNQLKLNILKAELKLFHRVEPHSWKEM